MAWKLPREFVKQHFIPLHVAQKQKRHELATGAKAKSVLKLVASDAIVRVEPTPTPKQEEAR